ncbi:serine/threonine-protein kinase Nek8-like isoform X2 [Daktulosphaira vitifoliae]|nr:serine/threonine-protein kinase Nek8-like isoform X2 [Daktulosphaira vitifoliae]XP_050536504.1 serine/threonine-protein kinase Nek8-like isoform X2 [Daktulosphaira vitifoliae]
MSTEDLKEAIKETHILEMLDHPNIIKYYKSFQSEQNFHIVMEYATHGSLENFVSKCSLSSDHIAQSCVLNIFSQLIMAVNYIHKMKIIHRDINPMNILLTGSQGTVVKLGDFGSSHLLNSDKVSSGNNCTPCYMSPEQCCGKPLRLKSDIWQVGCVLYYLMSMKHLFYGQSLAEVVSCIVEGVFNPLKTINYYDADLVRLMSELLNHDPTNRPDASEILSHPHVLPFILHSTNHWLKSGRRSIGKK